MLASKIKPQRGLSLQRRRAVLVCGSNFNGATEPSTTVSFKLHYRCQLGQHLCVSGSEKTLGKWSVEDAVQMNWTSEDVWVVDVDLSHSKPIDFEYKYFVREADGKTAVDWMEGDNLAFSLPAFRDDGVRASSVRVHDAWDKAMRDITLNVDITGNDQPSTYSGPKPDSWMAELLAPGSTKAAAHPMPRVPVKTIAVASGERKPADNAELTTRMDAIETEVFGLKDHVKTEMETLREEVKTVTKESVLFVLKRISDVDNSVNELRSQTADALSSIHESIRELNKVSERLTKYENGSGAVTGGQRFERETAVRELARASPRNNGWRR